MLTKESAESVGHFAKRELPGGWSLWSDAAVASSYSQRGADYVLLRGHWADLSDDAGPHADVAAALLTSRRSGTEPFHEHLGRLAGRYVVIMGFDSTQRVYHDATGLRTVYYSTQSATVSSHLRLLNKIERHPTSLSLRVALVAMDQTPLAGIRQLLPNFFLDVESVRAVRYFPNGPNRYTEMTIDDRLTRVETLWRRELLSYATTHPKIAVSVTGGLDSRLMLAMSRDFWPDYTSYTYGLSRAGTSSWAQSMSLDHDIVRDLLPQLGMRSHEFIELAEREPVPAKLAQLIRRNTWASHGRYLVASYRKLFPDDGWLHMRGTGVEVIRRYWRLKSTSLSQLLDLFKRSGSPDLGPRARALGYADDLHGYNRTDIMYWEIRMGKWHAELLNEQDAAFDTFLPISTREIYQLLLAFTEKEREDAFAVRELINRNAAVLNFFGANDRRNLYEQVRDADGVEPCATFESISVQDSAGTILTTRSDASALHFSRDQLDVGNAATGILFSATRPGTISFVLDQPYANPKALGTFEWQILVNGEARMRCDGAASSDPVHVRVGALSASDVVSIRLVALRTVKGASWESATRTSALDLRFRPGDPAGDPRVVSDSLYATATK